jgi:hypothetical protein
MKQNHWKGSFPKKKEKKEKKEKKVHTFVHTCISIICIVYLFVCLMVLNATFNNSVISCQSVLLIVET